MTSIFSTDGKQTACTIIEAGPCVVTQVKTKDTDGYSAVQLGFGDKNEKHTNKSEANHFSKASTPSKKFVKEFRDYSLTKNIGETITVDIFAEGDKVEVVGTTKGKGFQGVVKRHGFHGVGEASHGQHDRQRAPLRRAQALVRQRQMVDLGFHEAGDLAMAFGAAPHLTL